MLILKDMLLVNLSLHTRTDTQSRADLRFQTLIFDHFLANKHTHAHIQTDTHLYNMVMFFFLFFLASRNMNILWVKI